MSRENVELLRRTIEAFNRRDFEAAIEVAHPDIVWESLVMAEQHVRHGRAEVLQYWQDLADHFSVFELAPRRVIDLGDSLVLDLAYRAVGKQSGLDMTGSEWQLCRFEGNRLIELRFYENVESALEAVGLRE